MTCHRSSGVALTIDQFDLVEPVSSVCLWHQLFLPVLIIHVYIFELGAFSMPEVF